MIEDIIPAISGAISGIAGMSGWEILFVLFSVAYICVVIYGIYRLYKYITKRSENFEVENDFEDNFKVE